MKRFLRALPRTCGALLALAAAGAAGYHFFYGDATGAAIHAEPTPKAEKQEAAAVRRVPVVLAPVERRRFELRLAVQGNVEAKHSAVVTPRVPGTIERLFVDEGDPVTAGKTKLFQTDSLKLQKALEIRKAELAVARCTRREKEASLERVAAELEKAVLDEKRFRRLHEQKVVSTEQYERYVLVLRQGRAQHKHGQSFVDLAAAQEKQAEDAVAMAEKDLRDSLVLSPIDGVVSHRYQEPGEMGIVGHKVLRIDDPSLVEVSAFLPAAHYPRVVPGTTKLHVHVGTRDLGEHTVSYRSPTIDARLRTFEVKCLVKDPPEGVAPGAMAEVRVVLERRQALGVPAGAVQRRSSGQVVFSVADGKATKLIVETGLETDGWLEVDGGDIREGMPVAVMGQFLLDEDTPVSVQKESQ